MQACLVTREWFVLKSDSAICSVDSFGTGGGVELADAANAIAHPAMTSTTGRPRRTTDLQVQIILKWHAEYREWRAGRPAIPTVRELARHLGLSRGAITDVIRRHGVYKQASPERRISAQQLRDRVMRRINK